MREILKKVQRWLLPPLVAWVGQGILHSILFSCRLRVKGIDHFHAAARGGRCILMLWHNRMAVMTNVLLRNGGQPYRYAAVISNSRDGELLAAMAKTYRQGRAIRVPHLARHRAVKEMINAIQEGTIIMITPDGPRGPAYSVKKGVAFTAKASQALIVPFSWKASRTWVLPTWDKMLIPKPFCTIDAIFGEPICLKDDERPLEDVAASLQRKLLDLI